jgi:putative oxygen-independent coproporphyrinogen III oxidase
MTGALASIAASNAAVSDVGPLAAEGPLALYVHWPFCVSKCPYCDFNSHVRERIDQAAFRTAYGRALAAWAERLPNRRLVSIFFGGGTPSLMEPATAASVIADAKRLWRAHGDVEITLEANPNSAEAARFAAFAEAGVNRISIGVQALDDTALRLLGRAHDSREAIAAVEMAQRAVPRVSLDLIYARPGQSVDAWTAELARATAFGTTHISAYQLTIEKGTPFFAMAARGALAVPDEDTQAVLYEATQDALERAGLYAYEISNHARPGAECRHNLVYWRYGDYVGVGPGAHGRLTGRDGASGIATAAHRKPEAWIAATLGDDPLALAETTPLARAERIAEMTMMGLRLTSGIARADVERIAGTALESAFDRRALDRLIAGGFLILDDAGLRATAAGRARLNAVLPALLP